MTSKKRIAAEIIAGGVIVALAVFSFWPAKEEKEHYTLDHQQIVYDGYVYKNKFNGAGKLKIEGDTYQGHFKDGRFDGQGTFVSHDGWRYVGAFKKGAPSGQGSLTTEDKTVFTGTFVDGEFQKDGQADAGKKTTSSSEATATSSTATKTTTTSSSAAAKNDAASTIPKGVSIIGDSVTLDTGKYLGEHVADSNVDAEENRAMDLALEVMNKQIASNLLRQTVVICIGTNAHANSKPLAQQLIDTLPAGHRLIFMTPHDASTGADGYSGQLRDFEYTLPDKYDYITIADWHKIAVAHPEIFVGTDGTHFGGNAAGDKLYAACINDAVKAAAKKPAKS